LNRPPVGHHRPNPSKPIPFTEEQIRARAYQLWQIGGDQQSADGYWQAALEALRQERSLVCAKHVSLVWRVNQTWQMATNKENRVFTLDVVKVVISGFGVLATVFAGVGLYLTYQNSQAERQLNTERLVTDRFSKAVEQLGSQDVDVRLGGIYSLERVAKDSPKDHGTVMEVLTAYVRNKSPVPKGWKSTPSEKRKPLEAVATDVKSALTVIGRREAKQDPEGQWLDLRHSNLSGANLNHANLNHANLNHAHLIGAGLFAANLSDAILEGDNLQGVDLTLANLQGANLSAANLKGTDLIHVKDVSPDQIKAAKNWQQAHYSPEFRKQLGLLPVQPAKPQSSTPTPKPSSPQPPAPKP